MARRSGRGWEGRSVSGSVFGSGDPWGPRWGPRWGSRWVRRTARGSGRTCPDRRTWWDRSRRILQGTRSPPSRTPPARTWSPRRRTGASPSGFRSCSSLPHRTRRCPGRTRCRYRSRMACRTWWDRRRRIPPGTQSPPCRRPRPQAGTPRRRTGANLSGFRSCSSRRSRRRSWTARLGCRRRIRRESPGGCVPPAPAGDGAEGRGAARRRGARGPSPPGEGCRGNCKRETFLSRFVLSYVRHGQGQGQVQQLSVLGSRENVAGVILRSRTLCLDHGSFKCGTTTSSYG